MKYQKNLYKKSSYLTDYVSSTRYTYRRWSDYPNKDSILNTLREERQRFREQLISRYTGQYLNKVSLSENEIEAIRLAGNEQEVIRTIDKAFKEVIQKELDKTINNALNSADYFNALEESYQIFSKGNTNDTTGFQQFKHFIRIINDTSQVLQAEAPAFCVLVKKMLNAKTRAQLSKLIESFLKKQKITTVSEKKVVAIVEQLEKILNQINKMEKGTTLKKAPVNALVKIMSTELGEHHVAAHIANLAGNAFAASDILTGLENLDESSYNQKEWEMRSYQSKTRKTDVGGALVETSVNLNNTELDIVMEIGASVKSYKDLVSVKSGDVHLTSEKSLEHRLWQYIKDTSKIITYYDFANIIVHRKEEGETAWNELRRVIITRNLDNFISGAIGNDFSQYLIINGEVYSIYEMVLAVDQLVNENAKMGKNRANMGIITMNTTPGANDDNTIPSFVKEEDENLFNAVVRASSRNAPAIEKMGFSISFFPKRLTQLTTLNQRIKA